MQAAENPQVAEAVRQAYSGMGDTLYFDIAKGTHAVLYELPEERFNWLWYARYAVLRCAMLCMLCLLCHPACPVGCISCLEPTERMLLATVCGLLCCTALPCV